MPALESFVKSIGSFIESNKEVLTTVGKVILVIAAFKAGVLAANVATGLWRVAVDMVTTSTKGAVKGVKALNIAMKANVFGVVIVYLTLTLPAVILYESFLSYLGLVIHPPRASLGSLIAEGAAQLTPLRVFGG